MSALDNARADEEPKVRIFVNSNSHMSRGKYAAAAVHAALTAAGVHPGLPVVVLGAQRDHVMKHDTVIYDAGRTEVEPGTPTAGTSWKPERVATEDDRAALAQLLTGLDDREWKIATAEGTWHLRIYFEVADKIIAAGWRPVHTDRSADA